MGYNEPTAWGESWQNNGLFVHQDASETTIRNLGHQAPVRPGESVEIHTYSNSQRFFTPTDFRLRPAERRLVPLQDRSYQVLVHSEWGNNFNHAIAVVNTSDRIIQNWEIHFDVAGGGMTIDSAPNAQIVQTTSGSAILLYIPGDGQVLHPGQNLHMGMIGTFVPGSSITNVRIYERVGTAYGGWPDFVPELEPTPSPSPQPTPPPTPSPPPDGTDPDDPYDPSNGYPEPPPDDRRVLHGINFEQNTDHGYTDLIPPFINDIDIEFMRILYGIYRITLSVSDVTLDPRSVEPFFFWASNEGTFHYVIDYRAPYAQFVFKADPGTANRDVQLIIGIGDGLGQVDRVLLTLKGNDADYPVAPVAFSAQQFAPMPMMAASNVFDASAPTNIAFALDTSAAMNYVDPDVEIPGILAGLTHSAPFGAYFSVVAGGSVATLSDTYGATRALERVMSYGGTVDISEVLAIAASTLGMGDGQNVIVLVTSTWHYGLATQVQDLERRGFIVYVVGHEPDMGALELQGLLEQLPVFSGTPGFAPFAATSDITFNDVPYGHWARPYIVDMYRRGLIYFIQGNDGRYIFPNENLSVFHFVRLALRVAGITLPPIIGAWEQPYIQFAIDNGFFDTQPELRGLSFDELASSGLIHEYVTREYAFYLTYRIFRHPDAQTWSRLSHLPFRFDMIFDDEDLIRAEYAPSIFALVNRSIISGRPLRPGQFFPDLDPLGNITRAEMIVALFNMVTPHGSMYWSTRRWDGYDLFEFNPIDPHGNTNTLWESASAAGTFNLFGAGHHTFDPEQTGVYIFRTGTLEDPGRVPYVFIEVGRGFDTRYERLRPSWGSTNIFYLSADYRFILETVGDPLQLYIATVTRRGEYFANVFHYYDQGYTLHRGLTTDFAARFYGFDEIANRIFFELAGMHILSNVSESTFRSQMDICRSRRNLRYGNVGTGHLCVTPPDPSPNYQPHIHGSECWHPEYHILYCGRVQHCYLYSTGQNASWPLHPSCSNAYRFAYELMETEHNAGSGVPGHGTPQNIVVTWSGNATWSQFSRRSTSTSFDRSFVWRRSSSRSGNIFMFPRANRNDNSILHVYIHELAHIFGARDHYHEIVCDETNECIAGHMCAHPGCVPETHHRYIRPSWCIMATTSSWRDMRDVHAHSLFCDDCAREVIAFISNPANSNYFRR